MVLITYELFYFLFLNNVGYAVDILVFSQVVSVCFFDDFSYRYVVFLNSFIIYFFLPTLPSNIFFNSFVVQNGV